MRKFVSFVFALILCLSMAVTASAPTVKSNPGGKPTAPRTGSVAVAVLSAAACTASGVGAIAYKKSKE